MPAFGIRYDDTEYNDTDYDALAAFFAQTDPDGVPNGYKALYHWHPSYPPTRGDGVEYDESDIVSSFETERFVVWNRTPVETDDGARYYGTLLVFSISSCYIIPDAVSAPDYYGTLDLSGTSLCSLEDNGGPNHLEAIILDNCSQLTSIDYHGSSGCIRLSALNCPVDRIQTASLYELSLSLADADGDLFVDTIGDGGFSTRYDAITNSKVRLLSYSDSGIFQGWYKDGVRVSTEEVFFSEMSGSYTAVFAGDADDNGILNVIDALTVMRTALSLRGSETPSFEDINGDGSIGVNDALMLLRHVLGLK